MAQHEAAHPLSLASSVLKLYPLTRSLGGIGVGRRWYSRMRSVSTGLRATAAGREPTAAREAFMPVFVGAMRVIAVAGEVSVSAAHGAS